MNERPAYNAGTDAPTPLQAATEQEFIELVRQVLHSSTVRSLIQSLIARSNEARAGE